MSFYLGGSSLIAVYQGDFNYHQSIKAVRNKTHYVNDLMYFAMERL